MFQHSGRFHDVFLVDRTNVDASILRAKESIYLQIYQDSVVNSGFVFNKCLCETYRHFRCTQELKQSLQGTEGGSLHVHTLVLQLYGIQSLFQLTDQLILHMYNK